MSDNSTSKVVAYYRVSTKKQGISGLGLEGQKRAVADYVGRNGGKLASEYTEVETGKRSDRPELAKAIGHAKRCGATLCIAKLDRLARNVHFVSGLMESGVNFVACDNPHANKFTIHILAAVAEHEAEAISLRTKAALQAAKRRGTLLGSARPGHWDGRESQRLAGLKKARQQAAKSHREAFHESYADLFSVVRELRNEGRSLQQIADELNQQGHTTRHGKAWNHVQVLRVLRRAG